MNIRDVEKKTGLSAHTIRFYEKAGVLPAITRSASGIRIFTEGDVTFLQFVAALRQTGMSLEDIAGFTSDGCILEKLQNGVMPPSPVERRMSILARHRSNLLAQREQIDKLLNAVDQKLQFYQAYLQHHASQFD